MWTCSKCGTRVDAGFEVCWKCGTSAEGVEDPTFVTADQAEAIVEPPVTETGITPPQREESSEPFDLVECYAARDYLEARFLAERLNEQGIQAIPDTFDLHESLGTMSAAPRIRVRSEQFQAARDWLEEYERHRGDANGISVLDE